MRDLNHKDDGLFDGKIAFTPYSVENDPFDVRNFEELKTHSRKLLDTEDKGKKEYEQFPQLQQDLFDALYKNVVNVNEEWKMKREFLLNRKIMETMIASPRYKELRVLTQLDIVNSTVGAELLSDESLQLVKNELKKERELLEQLMEAGDALDQAQSASGIPGQTGQSGSNGGNRRNKNKTPERTLEEAKQAYEEAMEQFQEAVEKQEFKRSVDRITQKVKDEVRETSDLISNWGLGASGSFQRKPPHEQMALLEKLRNSSKLKKVAQLAGRIRKLAQVHRREKIKEGLDETYSVKQGSDIARLIPSEMLRFLTPAQRQQFKMDLIEGKTIIYQVQGKQKKGKGPIVMCIDSSGSMDGPPEIWAKAVALILLEIAREQKRDFYCIHFSSGYRGKNLHTNEFLKTQPFEIEQLIDMAEYFEAGGTEFEPPLNAAREKIGTDALYSKADIIFVTDGQAVVRDAWLAEFKTWKKTNKVNIYSILIDSWDSSMASLKQFSDRVERLSNLKDTQEEIALNILVNV